nr:MAG TPA: hypothetical protein [Caudoviricetes sp.]
MNAKWEKAKANLIDVVFDLTEEINGIDDYALIEADLPLVDSLTTILKRMQDTQFDGEE